MQTAVDCILLLYLSRLSGMTDLQSETQRLHASAIQQFSLEMRAPAWVQNDGVLGAIEAPEIAGQFRELGVTNEYWLIHAKGLVTVLKARGPTGMMSNFARKVLFNFLPVAVINGLDTRQPLFPGEFEWQVALGKLWTSLMSRLALLSYRILAILVKVGDLTKDDMKSASSGCATSTFAEAQEIKQLLHQWMKKWYEPFARRLRQTVMLDQHFQAFVQDFSHLPDPFPFAQAYDYDNGLDATQHAWYLICALETERALLDLRELGQNETNCGQLAEQCDYLDEAICRVVPYIRSVKGHVTYTDIAICTFVTFASRWFEKHGHQTKIEWCQSVRSKLEDQCWNTALQGNLSCVNRVFLGWTVFVNPP